MVMGMGRDGIASPSLSLALKTIPNFPSLSKEDEGWGFPVWEAFSIPALFPISINIHFENHITYLKITQLKTKNK